MSVKLITPDTVPTLRVRRTVRGKVRTKYMRLPIHSHRKALDTWNAAYRLDGEWEAEQERM